MNATPSLGEVLVVEDTPASLALLSEQLTQAGYTVRQAPDGELALWTARQRPPELILLDIRMPGIDGFEVCRQLKADPGTAGVPVIFLSAMSEAEDKVRALGLGAVDFITKPYQGMEVLARVHTHLTLAHLRRDLETERTLLEERVQERTAVLRANEAQLRKLSLAVEQSPNMILITDVMGVIEYVNQSFCQITGYSAGEVIGKTPLTLQSDTPFAELYSALWRAIRSGGDWHGDVMNRTKDGRAIWLSVQVTPVRDEDGSITHFVTMHEDITARKRVEEELRQKTRELIRMNAELEQFTCLFSHDLQTPLSNIVHYAQLLERRYEGQIDTDCNEFIHFIVDSGKRLAEMSTALLLYSSITDQTNTFAVVSSADAAIQAIENIGLTTESTDPRITFGDLPEVFGERSLLVCLFQNLLGNAVKYRAPGRPSEISVTAKRESPDQWCFAVADNGIGIDPSFHEKIFQLFHRANPVSETEGTGIGLTLCRRIVNRLGGAIWVKSAPGSGSTFFFTLKSGPP